MTDQHNLITVTKAVDLASEHGASLTDRHIRRAARLGDIANAQRFTFGWMFTDHDFLYWLANRNKPGPKPQKVVK